MVAMQVVAMLTHPFFGSCDVCAYVRVGQSTGTGSPTRDHIWIWEAYTQFTHTSTSPSHPHVHRCRNISVLQSCLSKITLIREKDLDRARQYFEMLYLNDEVCV